MVLFERATFLVISSSNGGGSKPRDPHRFEKISNIIKQFKLSCSKMTAQFESMEVRNEKFASFIDYFTTNTYVMVIMSDPSIRKPLPSQQQAPSFSASRTLLAGAHQRTRGAHSHPPPLTL